MIISSQAQSPSMFPPFQIFWIRPCRNIADLLVLETLNTHSSSLHYSFYSDLWWTITDMDISEVCFSDDDVDLDLLPAISKLKSEKPA